MIRVTTFTDPFQPQRREQCSQAFESGARVCDALPAGYKLGVNVAVWRNGKIIDSDEPLCDGDHLHVLAAPTGPAVPYIFGAIAVAFIGAAIVKRLMPAEEQPEPLGDSAYSYYGFRNSYRAEGEALPVVYGTMRVAPPCINQSILGVLPSGGSSGGAVIVGRTETLNAMYAISHGPIEGLGSATGDVFTETDFNTLVGSGSAASLAGTQLNGIDGNQFVGTHEWRTGGGTQTAISGGNGFIGTTDVGTIYSLDFDIMEGLDSIDETSFPPGTVAFASRIQPGGAQNGDSTEFVSQFIASKSDIVSVQSLWKRGIYAQDSSSGKYNSKTVRLRIQYWATDSTDTTTGTVTILPEFLVTSNSPSPISVELPFVPFDPLTYTPPARRGWYKALGSTPASLKIDSTTGLKLIRPGTADVDSDVQFSFSCWFWARRWDQSRVVWLWNWTKKTSGGTWDNDDININGFNHLDHTTGDSHRAVGASLAVDVANTQGKGSDQAYLRFYASEANSSSFADQHCSCWMVHLGHKSQFGDDTLQSNTRPRAHIAFSYDQTPWTSTGGWAITRCWVNGVEKTVYPSKPGNQYPNSGLNGTKLGAIWGTFTSDHVRAGFKTDGTSSTTMLKLGQWQKAQSLNEEETSAVSICEFMLMDGLIGPGVPWLMYNQTDAYGNRTFTVESLKADPNVLVCLPMNEVMSGTTDIYQNHALATIGNTTMAGGAFEMSDTGAVKTDGPIWDPESGISTQTYWHVEVFKEAPTTDGSSGTDLTTIDAITSFKTQTFNYPEVAVYAMSVTASDQLNSSQPDLTLLVHGKRVKVWEGSSETNPTFTTEFSRNPAWIAMDLITSQPDGMGSIFAPYGTYENIDLPSFMAWANYCDEGTPDAYGEVEFYGLVTGYTLQTGYTDYWVDVRVGIQDTSDAVVQTLPASWAIGKFDSITETTSGQGLGPDWVTKDDIVGGLNNASNMMSVTSITYVDDSAAGTNGFNSYALIRFNWNRLDSSGNPIWPDGISTGDAEILAAGGTTADYLGKISQYEERCRFDGVFDQKNRPGWESVLEVFRSGRGMPVKAGNKIVATFDAPRDPVAFFGQGNIVDGSLSISYLSPDMNPNSVEVEILDADHNYEKRTVLVDHDSIQNPSAFNETRKERMAARGITRRSQATRDATYRLNRYNLLRREATFEAGPDSVTVLPGDRILLAHDVPQYGYSGRLTADYGIFNTHPAARGFFDSWTREGGDCTLTNEAVMEDGHAAAITGYSAKAVRAYSVPVFAQRPAGSQNASGYEALPRWASQHIAVATGLYPSNGLDTIDVLEKHIAFSVYFKEPDEGSGEFVRLNMYRLMDRTGAFVGQSTVASFRWISGVLTFNSFAGSGTSPYGMTQQVDSVGSGWYRATMTYQNDSATGAGSAAVGDHIQLRTYFSAPSATVPTLHPVAVGGRGNQFLKYGDPLDVDTGATSWTKYNDTVSGQSIGNSTTIAPPFYPNDTGTSAGDHGHVVVMTKDSAVAFGTTPTNLVQVAALPTGSAVSSWIGERICLTLYAQLDSTNAATNATMYVDLRDGPSVDSNNKLDGNGIRGIFTMDSAASSWSLSSIAVVDGTTTGTGTVANQVASVSPVRLNSANDSTRWVQIDMSYDFTPAGGEEMTQCAVGVFIDGVSGGDCVADIWGVRLHGAGGTASPPSSSDLVSPYPHQGVIMWGPMYEANYTGSGAPGDFSQGAALKLDRDVTLEAGNSYEVAVRSSSEVDMAYNADAYEVVGVDQSQVPSSGSTVKAARTDLFVSIPTKLTPRTGDIFSFGKVAASTEDLAVTSVSLDPETLTRKIQCIEYVEEVYDDTAFGTLGDATISDLPSPGSGNSAQSGRGDDGRGSAFAVYATAAPYRSPNGGTTPSIWISWSAPTGSRRWRETRLWITQVALDGEEGTPQHVTTVPSSVMSYRHDANDLDPAYTYIVRVQRVGLEGTAEPLNASPATAVIPVVTPTLPTAPSVAVSTSGWRQMYDVSSADLDRLQSLEGRVGGWLISLPGYILDPDVERKATAAIVFGATNADGDTHTKVVTRGKLASGKYGIADVTTPDSSDAFVDARTTTTIIGEDDYSAAGAIPADLDVTDKVLHWDSGSSALGPVNYDFTETDLVDADRVVATAIIQGYQVRPETLDDLRFTLGSESGRRWSIEGPMDDDGTNAKVELQWRWTSGASLSGVDYRPFEAGEVYFRKCQFRLVWTRPTSSYDVKLERFVVQLYTPPLFAPDDVDGGTF